MTDHADQPNRESDLLVAERVMGLIPPLKWYFVVRSLLLQNLLPAQ
jgi:hypothetical protein